MEIRDGNGVEYGHHLAKVVMGGENFGRMSLMQRNGTHSFVAA